MKLHVSSVERLLDIYKNFGGFVNETKLKEKLQELDLTPYERKTTTHPEFILVLTDDYQKELSRKG